MLVVLYYLKLLKKTKEGKVIAVGDGKLLKNGERAKCLIKKVIG